MVKKIIEKVFSNPAAYRYLRAFIYFGIRLNPIKSALDLKPGDRLLDFGCGTGDYSVIVDSPENDYFGIDLDERYIEQAKTLYESSYRKFKAGDIFDMNLPSKYFNKTLYAGVMHHMNDQQNESVLREINRVTADRVVIMDLSPGGWHLFNNLLCALDRGSYARSVEKQVELLQKTMNVVSVKNYYVRSGIQRLSLIVCEPRK